MLLPLIYAWDNYPIDQFPPLWRWMASQIQGGDFVIPKVAFEEVERKSPECGTWIRDNEIKRIEMTVEIVHEAMRIKGLLNIKDDNYHVKGVGENDILIISTASILGLELVSDEGRQHQLPDIRSKMKVPAVCGLAEVSVSCLNFVSLIKRSKQIFQ